VRVNVGFAADADDRNSMTIDDVAVRCLRRGGITVAV
jgi:hypothetical protein